MKVYTYSQARQQLASLLEEASRQGKVQIRRRDGRVFAVQPLKVEASPLETAKVSTDVSTEELIDVIRESRAGRYGNPDPTPPARNHPVRAKPRRRPARKG
jgi:hypothetical protein